jgi:probable rRNA maturation factor
MLAELSLAEAELSVLLTNDAGIQALNREHRDEDKPTDVLAFPIDEELASGQRLLGDIVISLDTAARQAASRRRELLCELRLLLAHGLLHLIGYDHGTPVEKRRMVALTRRLVRAASRSVKPPAGADQAPGSLPRRLGGARKMVQARGRRQRVRRSRVWERP